jgi:dTDP-4-amino-4,6-dideoxygalactose transaminase
MSANSLILLADPALGEEEKQALCAVIDSRWLTMGDRVAEFESAFAANHGVEGAVAVNSCTSGLHLCLAALGIGPGDEVLVPSLTFVATANAVLYTGATPVFVDLVDQDTPHMSLSDAQAKISARTKAVIVMHYGGYVIDLTAWREFADASGLYLVEDAAHSPCVNGVGIVSDATAFSFFTNKNMTTSEGGMVFARDPHILALMRQMRSHGMTSVTLDRHRGHAFTYDVNMLGYNYRMDELSAAIGLAQLSRVKEWNSRRRQLSTTYRARISEALPEVTIPFSAAHETAAHLMPVLLPAETHRPAVMTSLRKDGIQSSIHYPPVHSFTYYRERFPGISLPNTEAFFQRELSLPLHPTLTEADVNRVVMALAEATEASGN